MVQDGKFSKEYPANAVNPVNPEGSILGPTFFLLYINEILLSILMILLSTLSAIMDLICCNNKNWHLNINLI